EMLLFMPVLILWMQSSQVNGQQVNQIPRFLNVQEEEDFTAYCNSSSTLNSLQWYIQKPGERPVFLMRLVAGGEVKKHDRLTASFGETRKNSSLHIVATQTADVGTYFCAVHSAHQAPAACPHTSPGTLRAPPSLPSEQKPEKVEVTMPVKS
ncbi:T-cell receptor alpha chain V region CTL-L17, partial [Tupaia chinensis]